MPSQQITFTARSVPFGQIKTLVVTARGVGPAQQVQLTQNDVPGSVEITPQDDDTFSYETDYQLTNGETYNPYAFQANTFAVNILSPFLEKEVDLVVVDESPSVIDDFSVTALHNYGGLSDRHLWRHGSAIDPWTVLTIATESEFHVNYSGSIQVNGIWQSIPRTMVAYDSINISATQFGFTVKIDVTQIDWSSGITLVNVSVYQLDPDQHQINIQTYQIKATSHNKHFQFLADYTVGILYYFTADYWYTGEPQPRTLPQTQQTNQVVTLPMSLPTSTSGRGST